MGRYLNNLCRPCTPVPSSLRLPLIFTLTLHTSILMALTVGQAIGIGVAVGFAGSLILIAAILGISRIISAYYVPPNRVIAMQPQYSPAVLIPPPDAIEEINIGVHELCQLQDAESLAYHLEGFAELFFGHRFQRKPDAPESLFNESELVHLAGEPINGGTWSQSISNVSTRVPTIRCFLAQVIFKRMQPTCPVDDCLLPPEISSCYQLVCRVYDIPRRMRPIAA
ncbi:hypothetical protein NCS55_01246100 [Fusarium keratoplasticum]|nr:hypothetical protein NCS55_01246100 [Fusarium keratoplasticum]